MINMAVCDHHMPKLWEIELFAQAGLSFFSWRAGIKKNQLTAKLAGITMNRANLITRVDGMLLNHHSTISSWFKTGTFPLHRPSVPTTAWLAANR